MCVSMDEPVTVLCTGMDRAVAPIPDTTPADVARREEVSDSGDPSEDPGEPEMGDSIMSLEASLHSAEQSLKKEKTRREHMESLATTAGPRSPIDGHSTTKNVRVSVDTMLAINQLDTQSGLGYVVELVECEKMTGVRLRSVSRQWRSPDAGRTSARNLRFGVKSTNADWPLQDLVATLQAANKILVEEAAQQNVNSRGVWGWNPFGWCVEQSMRCRGA
eukprot:TRINITY_DN1010_c0_g1_i3.p1 TRINITY_DN1010_c0_g1~~TRINITY_DN1010_c0_g1_i3.p1  ORF type:complete len:219 (+),score=36.15 TRINITY_DN1010_c0_g1_i3:171-827(+)